MEKRIDFFSSRNVVSLTKCLILITFVIPTGASAQALNGGVVPSRDEVEIKVTNTDSPKREAIVILSPNHEDGNCPLSKNVENIKINSIVLEGVDGRSLAPQIRAAVSSLQESEGIEQKIDVICRIRDRVNAELARTGYIARVLVPPQEISDGVLRLVIVTGRVIETRVRGSVGNFGSVLNSRLEQIRAMDPFNKDEAVRILLNANDIPGLRVKLSLRNAGGKPGDLIADVDASAQSVIVLANIQNFGSNQLGREVATVHGEFFGLTGLADRTYISLSNSLQFDEIQIGQVGHEFALNNAGLRLAARLSLAQSEPDIANLDLQSRSLIAGLELSTPFVKKIGASARGVLGIEVMNQATRVLAGGVKAPFTHDQIRLIYTRVDGAMRKLDVNGNTVFSVDGQLELRKGIGILGATQRGTIENNFAPSRFEGDPKATVVRGELNSSINLGRYLSFDAKVFGQWANNPLLNLEEFSLGNYTIGRGYDPGANGGDRALAARIEPRLKFGMIGPIEVSMAGFVDVVGLWNLDSSAGTEAKRTLRSAGGGMRMILRDANNSARASLDILYAKPMDKVLVGDPLKPAGRLLVSLTTKILPWGSR
jgi:hemolysin activation/secretion protein